MAAANMDDTAASRWADMAAILKDTKECQEKVFRWLDRQKKNCMDGHTDGRTDANEEA
jgi:hypothetical protein